MAIERLEIERDINDFVKASRIINFMSDLYLSPKQRALVKFFSKYHIEAENPRPPKKRPHIPNIEILI